MFDPGLTLKTLNNQALILHVQDILLYEQVHTFNYCTLKLRFNICLTLSLLRVPKIPKKMSQILFCYFEKQIVLWKSTPKKVSFSHTP